MRLTLFLGAFGVVSTLGDFFSSLDVVIDWLCMMASRNFLLAHGGALAVFVFIDVGKQNRLVRGLVCLLSVSVREVLVLHFVSINL